MSPSKTTIALLLVLFAHSGQAQHATGLIFVDEASYRSIPLAATPLLGEVPKLVDLTSRFPKPGNQGEQRSCVGWATAYALKTYQEGVERKTNIDSVSQQFSPSFIYNQIKKSADCTAGATLVDALNLLRRDGVAPLDSFPYSESECSQLPSDAIRQISRPYAIADWRRVNVQDETEMKIQIAAGFPILAAIVVDNAFERLGKKTYDEYSGEDRGGHAVVVIGYSDGRGAFKIINSWGRRWGDDGYGWISYAAFRRIAREGYVAQDIVAVPPPPGQGEDAPTPSIITEEDDPPPPPPLQPSPTASLGIPQLFHNVNVAIPDAPGSDLGISMNVPGTVLNAKGRTLQIVAKFNYENGPPLYANPDEATYRDISGLVATGTNPTTIGSDNEDISQLYFTLPYYALNFPPTGGQRSYALSMTAYVYVDNQIVGQSYPVNFGLSW